MQVAMSDVVRRFKHDFGWKVQPPVVEDEQLPIQIGNDDNLSGENFTSNYTVSELMGRYWPLERHLLQPRRFLRFKSLACRGIVCDLGTHMPDLRL